MAIQPDSGFPEEGISFVHKALACQPDPFPLWNSPDYFKDSLKWMQKLIKHEMCKLLVKHSKSDLRFFGEKCKGRIPVWKQSFWQRNELMAPQKPFKYSFQRSTTIWVHLPPRFCTRNTQEKSCWGAERRATAQKWLNYFLGNRYRALWGPRKLLPGSLRRLEPRSWDAEKLRCWEAEMPRSWDAELLRSESARNSI